MARARPTSTVRRRTHMRRTFDARVDREWRRHQGEPWRVLRRVLRERFLHQHLDRLPGMVLELGPGPGRFTPILRAGRRQAVVAVDLSRKSLEAARSRSRPRGGLAPVHWVQGVGEHLPLRDGVFSGSIALGNVVCFASTDAGKLLRELARVTKPGGLLLADFATPVGAIQEFFHALARHRRLPGILRRRSYYLIDRVLETGFQPFAPARLTQWEFKFYTAEEATRALGKAGFRVVDTMSVAPVARMDDRLIASAHRDPRSWRSLLEVEERAGRRPGVSEAGDGFLVAAVRRSP